VANKGYISNLLNKLPVDFKSNIVEAFDHTLDTFQLGGNRKAMNFRWYACTSTTAATADAEFSVEHGLEAAPSKLIPIIDLTQIGSKMPVLTVTRAPDASRVYLSSPSTSVVFNFYVE
jgi:hypothetical protein